MPSRKKKLKLNQNGNPSSTFSAMQKEHEFNMNYYPSEFISYEYRAPMGYEHHDIYVPIQQTRKHRFEKSQVMQEKDDQATEAEAAATLTSLNSKRDDSLLISPEDPDNYKYHSLKYTHSRQSSTSFISTTAPTNPSNSPEPPAIIRRNHPCYIIPPIGKEKVTDTFDSMNSFERHTASVTSKGNRGKYRCGSCGAMKANHVCPVLMEQVLVNAVSTQTAPNGDKISVNSGVSVINVSKLPYKPVTPAEDEPSSTSC